jgi:hypothetical protein
MNIRFALIVPVVLALTWPPSAARAQDVPQKGHDVMTVGGVTQPAPPHGTTPEFAGASRTAEPVRTAKPQPQVTALPFDLSSLSPAQLAKRGAAPAAPEATAPPLENGKFADFSTALSAGGPVTAPGRKDAPASDARSIVGVFGQIPRPAWGRGLPLKPEEVVTLGPATGLDAPLAQPARPDATPARKKAPEVRTSLPRDPNAPAPAVAKPVPPAAAKPEVRP